MNRSFAVRAKINSDRTWIASLLIERWGSTIMVTRGVIHDVASLPAFVAATVEEPVGLVTYRIYGDQCEMTSLDSLKKGIGVGTALIEAVKVEARKAGCKRLWLITTNDNLHAIEFYRKRGFSLIAVHSNAIEISRKLKPSIPLLGLDDIPIRDEVEFAIEL